MCPFLCSKSELGDNCYTVGEGDPLWVSSVSVHDTCLTDVTHPILSLDQIKHVLEIAAEHKGSQSN